MIPSLPSRPDFSVTLEKNLWADFVELSCLLNKDNEISLNDILAIASGEDYEGPERGSEETGAQEDDFRQQFLDVFKYLKNRAQILYDAYPFTFLDNDTLYIDMDNLSLKQSLYLFLLYCSNLSQFTPSERYRLSHAFESASKSILQRMYPSFHVEIFGTASDPGDMFYGGKLIERFEKLADCLHTDIKKCVKENSRYDSPSGDGGLDLVGFMQLDGEGAETPFIPLCFAQCACSVDKWKEKQSSIRFDAWNQRFEQIAHYCEFIFVPFSLRGPDGKWSYTESDHFVTIPIDRIRFVHIAGVYSGCLDSFSRTDAYRIVTESISCLSEM